jgi:uncharacterized protein YndB with AHSA1/START domain
VKAGVAALLAGLASAGAATAEVTGVAPHGFRSAHTVQVAAAPGRVWDALLQPARWWDPSHTYSGKAASLRLEPRAGGCFCETLVNGEVRHMTVSDIRRPERLVLTGGLGPLGPEGVAGSMLVTVKPKGAGSELSLSYSVGGFSSMPFERLAPAVDGVLGGQVARLKRLSETGRADAPKQ